MAFLAGDEEGCHSILHAVHHSYIENQNNEKKAGSLGVNLWLIAVQLVDKDEIKQAG